MSDRSMLAVSTYSFMESFPSLVNELNWGVFGSLPSAHPWSFTMLSIFCFCFSLNFEIWTWLFLTFFPVIKLYFLHSFPLISQYFALIWLHYDCIYRKLFYIVTEWRSKHLGSVEFSIDNFSTYICFHESWQIRKFYYDTEDAGQLMYKRGKKLGIP